MRGGEEKEGGEKNNEEKKKRKKKKKKNEKKRKRENVNLTSPFFQALSRRIGVATVVFWGRLGLPIPFRIPIVGVMGPPIEVVKNPNPRFTFNSQLSGFCSVSRFVFKLWFTNSCVFFVSKVCFNTSLFRID